MPAALPALPLLRRRAVGALFFLAALLAACGEASRPATDDAPTGLIAPAATPLQSVAAPASAPAAEDRWQGRFRAHLKARSGGDLEFIVDGNVTLRRDPASPASAPVYVFDGRQTLSTVWINCTATVEPAVQPLPPGALRIDTSTNPPRYSFEAGNVWDAVVHGRCANGAASIPMRVPGRLEASGTLSVDGTTIAGVLDHGELRWEWSFSRPH